MSVVNTKISVYLIYLVKEELHKKLVSLDIADQYLLKVIL